MYIRTSNDLGEDQATWSAFQALNRPTAWPMRMDGLGNFNAPMGQTESKPCWDCYKTAPCWVRFKVENFKPGSAELTAVVKKDIEDIAIATVRILRRILVNKSADFKKRKTSLALMFQLEGHLDKATDPQDRSVDLDRAKAVAKYLTSQVTHQWNVQQLGQFQNGFGLNVETSAVGSQRPVSSTKARHNRRVEICVQPYVPTRAGLSLLMPA